MEDDEIITDPKKMPPLIPVVILIYCNFSFLFNYVLLETLTSTLAMDQWAWKPETAVRRMTQQCKMGSVSDNQNCKIVSSDKRPIMYDFYPHLTRVLSAG